jgi:peptidoglycan/LPS O-acetylase OafA/YrhL
VDLFFALSGFLITGILLDSRDRTDYYRRFYARRTRRIFPLYFAYVGVLAMVMPGAWTPWYVTYTMNVRVALANSWAPTVAGTAFFWSLCVEEQFYAVWPAIVKHLTHERFMRLCLLLVVVALAARCWAVTSGNLFAAYVLLPTRMDGLALGAAAAVLARRPGGFDRMARVAPWAFGAAVSGLAIVVWRTVPHYAGWDAPLMASLGYALTALAAIALIIQTLAARDGALLQRVFTFGPLRYTGRRCYGLYVLGGTAAVLAESFELSPALTAVLTVGLSFALAEASWRVIEAPIIRGLRTPVIAAGA